MQFAPRPVPVPCVRCGVTKVKSGGITGMCIACRAADPVMAQAKRDEHAAFKAQMNEWVMANSVPDPLGRRGIRKMKPSAFGFDPRFDKR